MENQIKSTAILNSEDVICVTEQYDDCDVDMSDCTSKLSDSEPDVDYPHLLELAEITKLRKRISPKD